MGFFPLGLPTCFLSPVLSHAFSLSFSLFSYFCPTFPPSSPILFSSHFLPSCPPPPHFLSLSTTLSLSVPMCVFVCLCIYLCLCLPLSPSVLSLSLSPSSLSHCPSPTHSLSTILQDMQTCAVFFLSPPLTVLAQTTIHCLPATESGPYIHSLQAGHEPPAHELGTCM